MQNNLTYRRISLDLILVKYKILLLGFIFLLVSTHGYAQQDSTQNSSVLPSTDSTQQKTASQKAKKGFKGRPGHSPKKAVLYALIPGGGQIYNKKYWKLPIVYGGIGGLGYLVVDSRIRYQCYRRSYLAEVDLDPTTVNTCDPLLNAAQLKIRRDAYLRQFEYASLGFVAFYALTLLDAFVDAHLMQFDISDDLSLRWQPQIQYDAFSPLEQKWQTGVQLSIELKAKPKVPAAFEF